MIALVLQQSSLQQLVLVLGSINSSIVVRTDEGKGRKDHIAVHQTPTLQQLALHFVSTADAQQ
jgi:hypothetical protein